jgi:O-antigen/teichoic acid export membrane protein
MGVPETQRHSVSDRMGAVLRRAPYASAGATTVALLLVLSTFTTTVERGSTRPWLDWVVLALAAYTVLVSLILVPKIVLPRARLAQSNERVALMRWSFALSAFLFGLGAWSLGAHDWALVSGTLVSVVLLVLTARTLRADPASP